MKQEEIDFLLKVVTCSVSVHMNKYFSECKVNGKTYQTELQNAFLHCDKAVMFFKKGFITKEEAFETIVTICNRKSID